MPQLITTYQHDYTSPVLDLLKPYNKVDKAKEVSAALEGRPKILGKETEVNGGDEVNSDENKLAKRSAEPEWTGIAPMGVLLEPKLISNEGDGKIPFCANDKPSKYLDDVRTDHPNIFDNLKALTPQELGVKVDNLRFKTTYQIDYGKQPVKIDLEQRNAVNIDLSEEQQAMQFGLDRKSRKLSTYDATLGKPVPKRYLFCKHCPVRVPCYPIVRYKKITEYMDTISCLGGKIIEAKIHDHSRCTRETCSHIMNITDCATRF